MKKIFVVILLAGLTRAYGQNLNDYEYDKIRIIDTVEEIQADIQPYSSSPKAKSDRYYYWYKANAIHATQGGYGGQLLNGHYLAYYPDQNLKQEGMFKRGLKDGVWKAWDRKGKLIESIKWTDGVIVAESQPIWKKIPFFRKNTKQSTQKPKPASGQ